MVNLTQEQIKEIAEELDMGFRCLVNKTNGELLFFPDTLKLYDIDTEAWEEEIEKFENNPSDYAEIKALESWNSFKIMEDFIKTITDNNKLKEKLINALQRRKPFREFKYVIDNSGEYRQLWFEFKDRSLQNWVIERYEELIELEEFNKENDF